MIGRNVIKTRLASENTTRKPEKIVAIVQQSLAENVLKSFWANHQRIGTKVGI